MADNNHNIGDDGSTPNTAVTPSISKTQVLSTVSINSGNASIKKEKTSKRSTQEYIHGPTTSRQLLARVAWLAFGFSLVFTGYHVAQSLVTSMYHSLGFTALCVIYINFAIGSLIAPVVNTSIMKPLVGESNSEKASMTLAASLYVVFILCLTTGNPTIVIVASVFKGLASGLLWISQGVWLTKLVSSFTRFSRDSLVIDDDAVSIVGLATGVFFTIYNANGIIGNGLTLGLLKSGTSVQVLLWIMAAVTSIGVIVISFSSRSPTYALSQTDCNTSADDMDSQPTLTGSTSTVGRKLLLHSVAERFKAIGKLLKERKTQLLLPYFICQGVNMAYTYGNYPTFLKYSAYIEQKRQTVAVEDETVDTTVAQNIAVGFLLYGLGSMIGSYLWGKLFDLFHSRLYPLLGCHFLLVLANQSILIGSVLLMSESKSLLALLSLVGFIFGLVDFLTNAIINNSIAKNHDDNQEALPSAFSLYRMCFCLGFAVASGLSSLLPEVSQLINSTSDGLYERYGWMIMILLNTLIMIMSVSAGGSLETLNNAENSWKRMLEGAKSPNNTRRKSAFIMAH